MDVQKQSSACVKREGESDGGKTRATKRDEQWERELEHEGATRRDPRESRVVGDGKCRRESALQRFPADQVTEVVARRPRGP